LFFSFFEEHVPHFEIDWQALVPQRGNECPLVESLNQIAGEYKKKAQNRINAILSFFTV